MILVKRGDRIEDHATSQAWGLRGVWTVNHNESEWKTIMGKGWGGYTSEMASDMISLCAARSAVLPLAG